MTTKHYHGDDPHDDNTSKPVHFFRIMLSHNLLQGKLRIPSKFVRKYGKHLSNTVFLKLPNGAEWRVNLEKRDGSIWFHKGWKEFVAYHSLAHGHLLVFRYDGTPHFHVLICDMSTTEIEYPVNKPNHKRVKINSEEIQPQKTRRTIRNNKKSNSNLQDVVAFDQKVKNHKGKTKIEGLSISNCGADEAAGNTSFTLMMKSCHSTSMYLPKNPLKGYIKFGEQYVTLLVGNRSWRVKLSCYKNNSVSYFTTQWPIFVKENDLKEGDACLFQLLKSSDDMAMKVSISRYSSVKQ